MSDPEPDDDEREYGPNPTLLAELRARDTGTGTGTDDDRNAALADAGDTDGPDDGPEYENTTAIDERVFRGEAGSQLRSERERRLRNERERAALADTDTVEADDDGPDLCVGCGLHEGTHDAPAGDLRFDPDGQLCEDCWREVSFGERRRHRRNRRD